MLYDGKESVTVSTASFHQLFVFHDGKNLLCHLWKSTFMHHKVELLCAALENMSFVVLAITQKFGVSKSYGIALLYVTESHLHQSNNVRFFHAVI